jgi:uncharacterized protein YndB with AHSA1/START domain
VTFDVACSADHAFDVWTKQLGTWWPKDHTVGGGREVTVVLQAGVGGRIYEFGDDGAEHTWGRVTAWEPPVRLAYTWHIGRPASDATDVEIRFVAQGDDLTRVVIEQRGWERFGDEAQSWRARNRTGWDSLVPHYIAAITEPG